VTTTSHPQLYIDGEFRVADKAAPVLEAATGELLGDGASATEADIDAAVAAARAALAEWRSASPDHRAKLLTAFAAALHRRAASTNELVSRENGMPMRLSRSANGLFPAALLGYYAKLITETPIEEIRPSMTGHTIVRREAVGVVAAIVPWNYPQALAAFKLAPALAAGCTVVLKASPETALDALVFAEAAAEAGIPPGVLNVVPGGTEAGAHLVSHPGVDKVSFTGSTAVGRIIGEACGRLLRPVSLINNGQTCFLGSRILAPRSRYGEVVEALTALVGGLNVGNPLDMATDIGPVVSARQRDRVLGYIADGKSSGAKLVAGGDVPRDQPRGWFVEPTVFADVDNSARIAQEEIFGPVLAVIAYDSDQQAVAFANDSEFGLAGTVWSTDTERATEVAREIRTGTVGINDYQLDMNAPFGGVKASGIGRELGPEGLDEFFELKSIYRVGPA
jgi:aldehyde dehydrogenase (NAD+)